VRAERGPERADSAPLLAVKNLAAWHGSNQVLEDITFTAQPFECLALVGESGSGKTTLARCLGGLHENFTGEAHFSGQLLTPGARNRTQKLRREVQYIFQSPYNSLNPRRTIGEIVGMAVRQFLGLRGKELRSCVADALERVALGRDRLGQYPDQLSGGERQRVAIARAIVAQPSLLICDEVTSALDVSVQATIVELLAELRRELDVTMLFITHDLALVRSIADRVAVLSDGRIVELGQVDAVLDTPASEETRNLLDHTRSLDAALQAASGAPV
jgi:peptide/nickel transport system ATP-binding protein